MKLIVFDLDGTLTENKTIISHSMVDALRRLLSHFNVAVISGGMWNKFESQLISRLKVKKELSRKLHLFPASGTSFYSTKDGINWDCVYSETFNKQEVDKIYEAFNIVTSNPGVDLPTRTWGEKLLDRGTQITFSALGQDAPLDEKRDWDPTFSKRLCLIEKLIQLIPEFDIKAGGCTSIDITHKGIDKAYGISQIEKYLKIPRQEMVFVGDSLFPGGNDYPVKLAGVRCIETSGPGMTLKIIKELMK